MELIINNKHITSSIVSIITKLREEQNKYLNGKIIERGNNVLVTCPFHKNGKESTPSCSICAVEDEKVPFGTFHCWSCGESGSLSKLVGFCLDGDSDLGSRWLEENFGDIIIASSYTYFLPLDEKKEIEADESILDTFDYDNDVALDYLINKRHLNKDVIKYFKVGYKKDNNSIVFPVFDEHNKFLFITERLINYKKFIIPGNIIKPIYLLYDAKKYNTVYVCESQINALTLWGWGLPAIALFGTGSHTQYDILNGSGIIKYVLCFDGDQAGEKGRNRFVENVKNCIISYKKIPIGKDVNDLSKEEFFSLEENFI